MTDIRHWITALLGYSFVHHLVTAAFLLGLLSFALKMLDRRLSAGTKRKIDMIAQDWASKCLRATPVSVPGHALRCGPETSVTSPLRCEKTYVQSQRPWECGNPEGISKECGKGGKPASWLSMLSILCHFHALFFARCWINRYAANQCIAALGTRCSSTATAYLCVHWLFATDRDYEPS